MTELIEYKNFNEFFNSEYYKSTYNEDEFKRLSYEHCLGKSGKRYYYDWPQFDIAIIGTPRSYYEEVMFNPDLSKIRKTQFQGMAENGDKRHKKFGRCLCIIAEIHKQGDNYQEIYRSLSKIGEKKV